MSRGVKAGLIISGAFLLGAFCLQGSLGDSQRVAAIGTYWSAVSAFLAFGWLIAGYQMQNNELRLQREQLALQKQELELQRIEMHRMAEQATLGQVATMLTNFNASVSAYQLHAAGRPIAAVQDLPTSILDRLVLLRAIETGSAQERYNTYTLWGRYEGLALQFLRVIVSASRLYTSNVDGVHLSDDGSDDAATIVLNIETLRKIPHVDLYMQQAEPIAQLFHLRRTDLLRARLNGLTAMNEVIPNSVKSEALAELQRQLATSG